MLKTNIAIRSVALLALSVLAASFALFLATREAG
jgi:hypothetical protein